LPQQTNLADGAEVYGISLRLRSNRDGISTVKLTRRKDDWYVETIADRIIEFKEFEPLGDAARMALTVSRFLEQPS
jgi:predicted ABC-class ATPase